MMNIEKIGHCCLKITTEDITILTDPGMFTVDDHVLEGIDVVLYTHEHGDHFHLASLKELMEKNEDMDIYAGEGTSKLLTEEGISHIVMGDKDTTKIKDTIDLKSYDAPHQEIYQEFGQVKNIGFMIANRLYYPGDSFHNPEEDVDILALPAAAPWMAVREAVAYAKEVSPKHAFPVHDAVLSDGGKMFTNQILSGALSETETTYHQLDEGQSLSL